MDGCATAWRVASTPRHVQDAHWRIPSARWSGRRAREGGKCDDAHANGASRVGKHTGAGQHAQIGGLLSAPQRSRAREPVRHASVAQGGCRSQQQEEQWVHATPHLHPRVRLECERPSHGRPVRDSRRLGVFVHDCLQAALAGWLRHQRGPRKARRQRARRDHDVRRAWLFPPGRVPTATTPPARARPAAQLALE